MAFTFGFYNSKNHDRRYDSIQISMIFDGIIRDGIYSTLGEGMVVKVSTEPNTVVIAPGRGWFNHTWVYNDSDLLSVGDEPELILDRIDAVVIDINANEQFRENSIKWVKGVPSSNPVRPTLTKTLEHNQYPLAYIRRKANTTTILQTDVTNMVGTSECPFVTGILQTLSIDNLLLQWKDQWAQFVVQYEDAATTWMDEQKSDFNAYYTEFKRQMAEFQTVSGQQFSDWFANLQAIFDGNVAGHLQNEIDEINEREFLRFYTLSHGVTIINNQNGIITTTTAEAEQVTRFDKNASGDIITTTIIPTDGLFAYVKTTTITKDGNNDRIEVSYIKRPK